MKTNFTPRVVAFLTVSTLIAQAAPLVFNATESARPGDTIGLQGANDGASPSISIGIVNSSGVLGPLTTLYPNASLAGSYPPASTADYLSTQIPSTFGSGLYEVMVSDGTTSSAPVFMNRARITSVEFPEVDPGRSFRLFGRNLVVTGGTPAVRFVDNSTMASTSGTVASGGSAYNVTVTAPGSLVVGHTYTIYYKNGLGGAVGEISAPQPLPIRSGGSDPFALNLPWGADYANLPSNVYNVKTDVRLTHTAVGDGVTDDTAAIQQAITLASASSTGGVVYLPAGNYLISTFGGAGGGVGLTLSSNVVIEGDGPSSTFISFNQPTTTTAVAGMLAVAPASSVIGLYNLTLQSVAVTPPSGRYVYAIVNVNTDTTKFFVKNVTIDGKYWGPWGLRLTTSAGGGRFLITGSTIQNLRGDSDPVALKDFGSALNVTQYVYISNNTIPNFTQGLRLGGKNIIYENNTLTYDGSYYTRLVDPNGLNERAYTAVTGEDRLNLSGSDITILNNTFNHAGDPFVSHNDGENILCEDYGDYTVKPDMGTVAVGSTSTTLVTPDASLPNYVGFNVILVDGTGKGQMRTITACSGSTVTVDSPWGVVPIGNDTKYVINRLNVPHLLIQGNTMVNKECTAEIYQGGYDCAVVGNSSTNSGVIWLRAVTLFSTLKCCPLLDMLVADNTLTTTDNSTPAEIRLEANYADTTRFATAAIMTEIRRNSVTSTATEAYEIANTDAQEGWHSQGSTPPYAIDGVILDGNAANGQPTAYGWVPGVEGMAISNYTDTNVTRNSYDISHGDGALGVGTSFTSAGTLLLNGATTGFVDVGSLTFPTQMTVEGRFKASTTGNLTILGNRNIGACVISVNNGKMTIWDNNFGVGTAALKSIQTINTNQTYQFTWTCDGAIGSNNLYLAGVYENSNTSIRSSSTGQGSIGADVPSLTNPAVVRPFNGELSEIRIWNGIRSTTDIGNFSQTALAGDEPGLLQYWPLNDGAGQIAYNHVLSSDLAVGLIGYWRFDDATGTTAADSSGNGNIGTLMGGAFASPWPLGCYGTALQFPGTATSYVAVPHNTALDPASMSIHARIRIDSISTSAPDNFRAIINKGSPATVHTGWEFGTYSPTGITPVPVGIYVRRGTGSGVVSCYGTATSTSSLAVGKIYAVDATWNAATGLMSVYVNGVLQSTTTNTSAQTGSTNEVDIGSQTGGHPFNGMIDDLKIYNRALSAQEVSELSAAP